MTYISNTLELNKAIVKMYNHEISPYELAEVYFKYKLYSAAATYYTLQLNDLINCDKENYDLKSYCFSKLAECYFNQQKDHLFSQWQLSMIYDMCRESLVYNSNNILTYLILGKCNILRNDLKNAYLTYNEMIMKLYKIKEIDKEYTSFFVESIIEYFNLSEQFQLIRYDNIYKEIVNFMINNKNFTFDDIYKISERYKKHLEYITPFEKDIMEGNIQKYYF